MMLSVLLIAATFQHAMASGMQADCELANCASRSAVLLQGKSSMLLAKDSLHNLEPLEYIATAQLLVDKVKQGRNLTDADIELVHNLIQIIDLQLIGDIMNQSAAEQQQLNDHAAVVAQCDKQLQNSPAAALQQETITFQRDLQVCQASLAAAVQQQNVTQTELNDLLNKASPPNATVSSTPQSQMSALIEEELLFWTNLNNSYTALAASLAANDQQVSNKAAACNLTEVSFRGKACSWKDAVTQTTQAYDQCRKMYINLYEEQRNISFSNSQRLKTSYSLYKQFECLLRVLTLPDAQGKIQGCTSAVVDTSTMDVVEPALPPYAEKGIEALGVSNADAACVGNSIYMFSMTP